MPTRRIEPFRWLLFSAGGMAAALLIPILLFLFGVAFPLGWISAPSHGHLLALAHNPVTVIVLLGLCVLALFHWAHRFRYALYDGLQIKHLNGLINVCCYGGATVGSIVAWIVLFSVP
jgi:succinate dehydrogenase subunit D